MELPDKSRPWIVWFRNDLRLADNPALQAAHASGAPVIPLYILDEHLEDRPLGAASRWWLDKSLAALAADLETLGAKLILRRGDSREVLQDVIADAGAGAVAWNRLYQAGATHRDEMLQTSLEKSGLKVLTFNGSFLAEPDAVRTQTGGAYKVFTPFAKAMGRHLHDLDLRPKPGKLARPSVWPPSDALDGCALHPSKPDWSERFPWTPGEAGAHERLNDFTAQLLGDYPRLRDRPDCDETSRLSPHLRWGEVSPARVIARVRWAVDADDAGPAAAQKFMAELLWREFNQHILAGFPDLHERPMRPKYAEFPWREDPGGVQAWRQGQTGYPIVDAGMRQLWTTGWMHNRVRMITASFLVKHLLIDWRQGERWFWDCLVDADPGNNPGNWQWSAGCGADAAPYFRIFSPEAQGKRFDPQGDYVRRWVPELKAVPAKWIHAPWSAPGLELEAAGVRLGHNYPQPIVDHAQARKRALAALSGLKGPDALFDEPDR